MDDETLRALGFGKEVDRKQSGFCPFCSQPVCFEEFRDEKSRREYRISGLCQACQDKAFDGDE